MNTNRLHGLAIAAQIDDARRGDVGERWDRRDSDILDALFVELSRLGLKPDAGDAEVDLYCHCEITRVIPLERGQLLECGPVVAKARSPVDDPSNLYPYGRALIRACLEFCEAADSLNLPEIGDRCRGSSARLAASLWNQLGKAADDGRSIFKIRERALALPNGRADYRDRCLETFAQVIEAGRMAGVVEGMRLAIAAIGDANDAGHVGCGEDYEDELALLSEALAERPSFVELDREGGDDGEA